MREIHALKKISDGSLRRTECTGATNDSAKCQHQRKKKHHLSFAVKDVTLSGSKGAKNTIALVMFSPPSH